MILFASSIAQCIAAQRDLSLACGPRVRLKSVQRRHQSCQEYRWTTSLRILKWSLHRPVNESTAVACAPRLANNQVVVRQNEC
jgi:hypothetical protein